MIIGLIPCAGRGSRLGSLGQALPKCLLTVNGKTLLDMAITSVVEQGAAKVVLVVNTHENLIRKHVEHHSYPVPVRLVRQTVLNGLPGAIAAAIPELEGTVLMHLPDNVFTDKYDYALAQHERVKGTLTTIVEPIAPRFGRPAATVQDGRITRIAPSTGTQGEHSVAGLYIFGRYFAELCRKHCEASTEGEVEIGAVMKDLLSSGKIIGAAVIHGIRHDVSTLQDRDRAANNVEG